MDLHERLVAARQHAGFESATDAAKALNVPYGTYAGHENGSSGFRADRGELYARRFKVRFEWLMRGKGPMTGDESVETEVPVMGRVGAGAEVEPDFEQVPPDGLFQVTVPIPLPAEMVAFQVQGDSMLPQYEDGMVIIVFKEQRRATETFYGETAVVRTLDGRRFVKTIERGAEGGVTLRSWNAKPIENVSLDWIGEIFTYFPASAIRREVRRIERQGGIQGRLALKSA
jgi:phage repressor protein C with HTH and peptisase S24 domain